MCRPVMPKFGLSKSQMTLTRWVVTQSRRATTYRDGNFIRLLTIAPDHDGTYGKK